MCLTIKSTERPAKPIIGYKVYAPHEDGILRAIYAGCKIIPNEEGNVVSDRAKYVECSAIAPNKVTEYEEDENEIEHGIHIFLGLADAKKLQAMYQARLFEVQGLPDDFVASGTSNVLSPNEPSAVFVKVKLLREV